MTHLVSAFRTGALAAGLSSAVLAILLVGAVSIWVDPQGRTVLTDQAEPPLEGAERVEVEELIERWDGRRFGGPITEGSDSSSADDRLDREVREVLGDLERGGRPSVLPDLRRLHRTHPTRPDIAIALSEEERRRGRFEAAESVLVEMLATPGSLQEPWESRARRALDEVREEIDVSKLTGGEEVQRAVETEHFRVTYDHRLAGRPYGERVTGLLEGVRSYLDQSLRRSLAEPLDVHLYTKARYLDNYRHRFGFATVGFYDGAIHVVAARHPSDDLLALLTHEYSHALFRDAVGSDQPFFLNEGIAEREEERIRGRHGLVRAQWWKLVDAIRAKEWIPLSKLAPGFGGLEGKRALLGYLESRAAVEVIEARRPGAISRWLNRCARGQSWTRALVRESGWDVRGLDAAVREAALGRFAQDPLADGPLPASR
jgi:hypothetical protein